MNLKEKTFKRRKVYSGKIVNFSVDEVILPNRKRAYREYMEHPGAVCVLPFVDKNRIVLVKQYRYPIKKTIYELPAGKLDKGENLLSCVKRELQEETGFYAKKIKKLFSFLPTPAFGNEVIHIFVAKNLVPTKHKPDEDEFIQKKIVAFNKALQWLKAGKIRDSKTVIAILLWRLFNKNR